MSSDEHTMKNQTPSSHSEDTSPSEDEAAHTPPQSEEQVISASMSEVSSNTAHEGSVSEDVALPRVSPVNTPTQNVSKSTTEDSWVTSYVTEHQANHSRPFEANQNTAVEGRQADMVARLATIMRPLQGLVNRYPPTITEATEELVEQSPDLLVVSWDRIRPEISLPPTDGHIYRLVVGGEVEDIRL